MTEENKASSPNLESRWDELLFHIDRSIRYNDRRSSFWGRLDRASNAINLVMGSGVIFGLLKESGNLSAGCAVLNN